DDCLLEFYIFIQVLHLRDKDEVKVRSLRIEMRGMRHAHRLRPALDKFPYSLIKVEYIIPGYARFQGIDHNAEVLKIFPHIGVGIPPVLPLRYRITGDIEAPKTFTYFFHLPLYVYGEALFPLGGADKKAAPH